MKIAIAQINPIVGNFSYNKKKILNFYNKAKNKKADLVIFPELCVCGYPPKDFLENNDFVNKSINTLHEIKKHITGPACVIGNIDINRKRAGKPLFNSAYFIHNKKIVAKVDKTLIPTYDVFDEGRYFEPNVVFNIVPFQNKKIGITICEDIWNIDGDLIARTYNQDPLKELSWLGAEIIINISSSPFAAGKLSTRQDLLSSIASRYGVHIFYANQVGGNDELIFDGNSLCFDNKANLVAKASGFKEDFVLVDISKNNHPIRFKAPVKEEEIFNALTLGTRDYLNKCGFSSAVVGLSGGIDSAVTLVIAKEALGAKNVYAVLMPSKYSSKESVIDAKALAKNLGVKHSLVPIHKIYDSYLQTLKKEFKNKKQDIAEENIQARIRGNILMGISNKFGSLVLSTGNKSELACGYCTIYGDMAGGLSIISDLLKTNVYKVAHYINRKKEIIPSRTISKAPSAELRPNQKDEDSLPPYEVLDEILKYYVEENLLPEKIIKYGFSKNLVNKIIGLITNSEYKRRQAAPGLRITTKAFGSGRRLPIAHGYK